MPSFYQNPLPAATYANVYAYHDFLGITYPENALGPSKHWLKNIFWASENGRRLFLTPVFLLLDASIRRNRPGIGLHRRQKFTLGHAAIWI